MSFAQCAGLAGCIPVDCANPHEAPNARVRGGVTAVGWDGALATSNKNYRSFAVALRGPQDTRRNKVTQETPHMQQSKPCVPRRPPAQNAITQDRDKGRSQGRVPKEAVPRCRPGGSETRGADVVEVARAENTASWCPQEQTSAKACHSRNRASCAGAPAQSRVDAAAGAGALVGNWTNRAGAKKERARNS